MTIDRPPSTSAHAGNAWSTKALAEKLQAELVGPPDIVVTSIDALDHARPDQLTFIRGPKFAKGWTASQSRAALVTRGLTVAGHDPTTRALLFVSDADQALNKVLDLFMPAAILPDPGVHATAVIGQDAQVDPTARIGPHVSLGPGAKVGAHTTLHAGARIGPHAQIGSHTTIHSNVVILDRCVVGNHCIIHANTVIGADGFGYLPAPDGKGIAKIPHIGNVVIHDHVEIGASSCVDRGKFSSTVIGMGTKIDNLVQIAHNCKLGRFVLIAGMSGVAGSVTIGDGAMLGGAVGVVDGVTIGQGARIAGRSGVMTDVPPGETYAGAPAMPHRDWARLMVAQRRLLGSMITDYSKDNT